ncbi:hypothetical protein MIND_00807400 [Mycena indigotica]|uniref:Uncharacterized protein n=1 Tax=Mycena indigotica TaxID=2126181 RepID=A0A8H6SFJ6_9AGAR|nr:uncharacterized protein MIND_00807400 [Mycena indigotica]KAF7298603.1 hypothetical protein MIND_00807400 [Mycena indigotica]
MHEFELGVWKNLFTHLIRLLYAMPDGPSLVAELDSRYRQVPRFGIDTIRRFATNASEMKKLSARDFEDLLQCAIPVFEGLFSLPDTDEHNSCILKLLYRLAEWHGYAKLRMHTDQTLDHLDMLTSQLGTLMRNFQQTTCTAFKTKELPREARHRHDQAISSGSKTSSSTPKLKAFNLNTYKWHSLGDYVPTIRLFGTTDIYSTQIAILQGESLHRLLKRMYTLTNKNGHERQLAQRYMRVARARAAARANRARQPRHFHLVRSGLSDPLGMVSMRVHHHTSWARRSPIDIPRFVGTQDPAMKDFYPKLQDHILGRLQHRIFDGDDHHDFTDADRNTVYVLNNALYATKTLRVNYTTYDVRRDYNTVNPLTTPFVLMRAPDSGLAHPYWYCKVIGIFHARAYRSLLTGTTPPVAMEILWVRWMGIVPERPGDIEAAQLPQVGFVPEDDPYAFGFLDPAQVIRASHLIPRFAGGRTNDLLSTQKPTAARLFDETDDWKSYYVDIFADRDMLMRYVGGGVGHLDCAISSFDSVPPHAEPPTLPTITPLQPSAPNATNEAEEDIDLEDINETDVVVDDGDDEVTEINMENDLEEPEFYYDEDYGTGGEEEEEIEDESDCNSQLDDNDFDIHAYSY